MTNEQIGIIAGIVIGSLTLQTTVILWSINRVEKSLNKRIDDFKQEFKDLLKLEVKRLEDLFKSEIKRLEDKIEQRIKVN